MEDRLREILERIGNGFSALRQRVPEIAQDPRAYPRESMLLAVVAALALIFLVTAVAVVWDSAQHRVRLRRAGLRLRRRFPFARLAIAVAAIAAAVGLAALAPHFAAPSRACGECHATTEARDSWAASEHAGIGCFGCHAAPGPGGALAAVWTGATRRLGVGGPAAGVTADSRSCLACHDEVATGVVGSAVRMSHAEVIAAGTPCTACHGGAGHGVPYGDTSELERSVMSRCLICHDDRTAAAACETCHRANPSDRAAAPHGTPTAIVPTCDGCHAAALEQACVDCHGLELPHPALFFSEHAGRSDANPALCAKCHESATTANSCGCHPDGATHGPFAPWFAIHGTQAATSGPGGCRCHDKGGFAQCRTCHATSPW